MLQKRVPWHIISKLACNIGRSGCAIGFVGTSCLPSIVMADQALPPERFNDSVRTSFQRPLIGSRMVAENSFGSLKGSYRHQTSRILLLHVFSTICVKYMGIIAYKDGLSTCNLCLPFHLSQLGHLAPTIHNAIRYVLY